MMEHAGDILLGIAWMILAFLVVVLTWDFAREWWHGDTEGDDEPDTDPKEPR